MLKLKSCYRDLNSGPLPYQGSALPLSYNSKEWSGKRGSNPRPPAWKASALSTELFPQIKLRTNNQNINKSSKRGGQRWIRTTEGVSQQIYSLPHLATLVFARPDEKIILVLRNTLSCSRASCRIRTNDPEITNHVLWPTELKRQALQPLSQ